MNNKFFLAVLLLLCVLSGRAEVTLGVDVLFDEGLDVKLFKGKRLGLVSNQTAINRECKTTLDILKNHPQKYLLKALFAPEHGFYGDVYSDESVSDQKIGSIPVYSLHGQTRRPTNEMLKNIDVLIFDIQDIGSRSYTYLSTLCYCMEEAAKRHIKVVVLDRPNPLGGTLVDGPLLEEKWRSFIGYINVPYCHGMTIGELAHFFNGEYQIECDLEVIPMKGWNRSMTFRDTGLMWVPTSPQIPEEDTPFFYPTTGLIGQCSLLSIGIGYTLPFKIVGAPWIDAVKFAKQLNSQKLPGVYFQPFYFRPFFGKFKSEDCQGVRIVMTHPLVYLPVTTQFTVMGVLKNLYPKKFDEAMQTVLASNHRKETFHKLNGNENILKLVCEEKFFVWKIRDIFKKDREKFLISRKKYLSPAYMISNR